MDARQQKAHEIAGSGRITLAHGYWLVPSQSGAAKHQGIVDGLFPSCSCKDFELREKDWKHLRAVRLHIDQQKNPPAPASDPRPVQPEPTPKVKKLTYKQDWPNYNLAQTREKDHFQEMLVDLGLDIVDTRPANPKGGSPRIP